MHSVLALSGSGVTLCVNAAGSLHPSTHSTKPIPPILHQQAAQVETEDELKWATTAMAFWHLPPTVSLSKSGGLNLQQEPFKVNMKAKCIHNSTNSIEIQFLPIVQSSPD